eukprot:6082368-Pyramimonas_sp.AAC.1
MPRCCHHRSHSEKINCSAACGSFGINIYTNTHSTAPRKYVSTPKCLVCIISNQTVHTDTNGKSNI